MASSDDRATALRELGRFVTAAEAAGIAARLGAGDHLNDAVKVAASGRRSRLHALLAATALDRDPAALIAVLHSVEGARRAATAIEPLWTMPGNVVQSSPLINRIPSLIDAARFSVTCTTYNFERSSGLWRALPAAAQRPGVAVRLYIDTNAAQPKKNHTPPSPADIADRLEPGVVLQTKEFNGTLVRSHAKIMVIDHRFTLISSANFSWSAETANVELGVQVDDRALAESIERQLRDAEPHLYRVVAPRPTKVAHAK